MPQKFFHNLRNKFKAMLQLQGTPHSIAMGIAAGVFWNFIPSLGVGPFLSMGLARLLRGSAIAALTGNLATGFFIPIFYSMNVLTGRFLTGDRVETKEIEENLQDSIQESLEKFEEIVEQPVSFFSLDRVSSLTSDFLIGALCNALICAVLVYFIAKPLFNRKFKLGDTEKADK